MTALPRLLLVTLASTLFVASCGQKGPLSLPEDASRLADDVPVVLCLSQDGAPCGPLPSVV